MPRRKLKSMPDRLVIMCRQASDSLKPGYVRGYFCRACGKELQVSPEGVRQLAAQIGTPCCNDCSYRLTARARAKHQLASDIILSQGAQETLRERGQLDELLRGKQVEHITVEDLISSRKRR